MTDEPIVIEGTLSAGSGETGYVLLPCPFCGATPAFLDRGDEFDFNRGWKDAIWDVCCPTEGCYLQFGADMWTSKEDAATMWNKRAGGYWTPETRLELIGVLFDLAAHNKTGVDGGLLHDLIYRSSDFLELNRYNYRDAIAVLERRQTGGRS